MSTLISALICVCTWLCQLCVCVCVCQLQRFTFLSTVFSYWQGVFQQFFPFNNVTAAFSCQRPQWKWKQRKQTYDDMKLKETWNLKKNWKNNLLSFDVRKSFISVSATFRNTPGQAKQKIKSKKAKRTMGVLPSFYFHYETDQKCIWQFNLYKWRFFSFFSCFFVCLFFRTFIFCVLFFLNLLPNLLSKTLWNVKQCASFLGKLGDKQYKLSSNLNEKNKGVSVI